MGSQQGGWWCSELVFTDSFENCAEGEGELFLVEGVSEPDPGDGQEALSVVDLCGWL